jgi:Arc/MetJ family transcription regulator
MMRTTLDLPELPLEELVKLVGAKTKGEAVTVAIEDYVRRRKCEELKAASGKIHLTENWRQLEEAELKECQDGK